MATFSTISSVMLFVVCLDGIESNSFPNVVDGLVACYPFEGNPNDIINGNDGIVRGAQLTTDRFGEQSAYSFGNWKYIDISSVSNVISNIDQLTISLWVLPYNFNAYSPMYPTIFSGWDGTAKDTGGTYFGLSTFGDWLGSGHEKYRKVQWRMSIKFKVNCDSYTNALPVGQWTHIVATFDGLKGTSSIYQNGQSVESCSRGISKTHNYAYVGLGIEAERMTGSYTQSHQWNGKIDDVSIYNRVLDEYEIMRLFDGTTLSPTTPTDSPTTAVPTATPTSYPTIFTMDPTHTPTLNPTEHPSNTPSRNPTNVPTFNPTTNPTHTPTKNPTISPSNLPTNYPTSVPTIAPTFVPSISPTNHPTIDPTSDPTDDPTVDPTFNPTLNPTNNPTNNPTIFPTNLPTNYPTSNPTVNPTFMPTIDPTYHPTVDPTGSPTTFPTNNPTIHPTFVPTFIPTFIPTKDPTFLPTNNPTESPTIFPTFDPSVDPTSDPTNDPTTDPTIDPTFIPTLNPTTAPTQSPTIEPTISPTMSPTTASPTTVYPTQPTLYPTNDPTFYPSSISWSEIAGISCSINNKIKSIDDISLNECKSQCVNKFSSCDSVTYFHLLDKTRKPRCYLFAEKCNGYSFTDNVPSTNVSTYIALSVNNKNDVLSECINYPRNWTDSLSEKCSSYHMYCLDNKIIPGMFDKIALHKDNRFGYSASDVCCVCGGGIYDFDHISLNPHIDDNIFNVEYANICHWTEYIQNMESKQGIKIDKFREWNVNDIFTLCERSLHGEKDQFQPSLLSNYEMNFELLLNATCYSAISNGTINICEDESNMDEIMIFNIRKNALYLNEKWINGSAFSSTFGEIAGNCYKQGMNDLIFQISACELLNDTKVVLSPTKQPSPAPDNFYALFIIIICGLILICIIVVWKIFVWKTQRNWKCQKKTIYQQTENNDDENSRSQRNNPVPSAPSLYPDEGHHSESVE